ncbi:MAG: transposase [Polyangiales bacterium]
MPFVEDAGGEDARFEARHRGVEHAGFNLHAGVCVAADDRVALERLCRYVARPAVVASAWSSSRTGAWRTA